VDSIEKLGVVLGLVEETEVVAGEEFEAAAEEGSEVVVGPAEGLGAVVVEESEVVGLVEGLGAVAVGLAEDLGVVADRAVPLVKELEGVHLDRVAKEL